MMHIVPSSPGDCKCTIKETPGVFKELVGQMEMTRLTIKK